MNSTILIDYERLLRKEKGKRKKGKGKGEGKEKEKGKLKERKPGELQTFNWTEVGVPLK